MQDTLTYVEPEDALISVYNQFVPYGLIMLPSAFYMLEFFMNKIYFDKSTWWLCFVPASLAFINVQMSYYKYKINLPSSLDDQVTRIYDWNNP